MKRKYSSLTALFYVLLALMSIFSISGLYSYSSNKGAKMGFELPESGKWINTQSDVAEKDLKGNIILLDFWTYCCINCIHVIPDLKYLEERFSEEPFIVIGVHSPKFDTEKNYSSVLSAVSRYSITHPVIADNDFILWNRYGITGWPGFVLLDGTGNVILKTGGEGRRDFLENAISMALKNGKSDGTLKSTPPSIRLINAEESFLKFPAKIDFDETSGLFALSDAGHNRIIIFSIRDSLAKIENIIGNGKRGLADGNFSSAEFDNPHGLAFDGNFLYIADTDNHSIRKADLKTGSVYTVAGNGSQGYTRVYSGKPLSVSLNSPWDIALSGGILYIAMAGNHQIWKFDEKKNTISSYAGNGYENITDGSINDASLAQPSGIAVSDGRVYFTDSEVSAVRYIDLKEEKVHTISGKGLFTFGLKDGKAENALFQHPLGIDIKGDTLYISDTYNNSIRLIDLKKMSVATLIGYDDKGVCKTDEKSCTYLQLYEPEDIIYHKGKILITDTNNHLIRMFDPSDGSMKDIDFSSD